MITSQKIETDIYAKPYNSLKYSKDYHDRHQKDSAQGCISCYGLYRKTDKKPSEYSVFCAIRILTLDVTIGNDTKEFLNLLESGQLTIDERTGEIRP